MPRRRRRSKVQRVINLIKKLIAFFFSHIGLCVLVIGYAMLGAVTFRAIESGHEERTQRLVTAARRTTVAVAWNTTFKINRLDRLVWQQRVLEQVQRFQKTLFTQIRRGYDGKELGLSAQWTFTGAFLYSLTVITTIGYGNTSCKTYFGKLVTIMYAIIGIPLMLLFLTNIGDVLAKTFKFLYSKTLRLRVQLVLWHKRRKAARLRRANSLVSRMTRRSGGSAGSRSHLNAKHDSSADSFAAGDVEELLTARLELEQLEKKTKVEQKLSRVTIPLTVVLLTMVIYLFMGSALFAIWEGWYFLDAFYFCFISLTTIGFGDLFPGGSVGGDKDAQKKLVITSVYLLFGMALLAMCFNLAQEEVVNKVIWVATKIGVVKQHDDSID